MTTTNQPYQQPYQATTHRSAMGQRGELTGAEKFWYYLGLMANYFAKVPVKKALSEYGYGTMTGGEKFWYVCFCICFGAGYFAKVPIKKALTEVVPMGAPSL
jgi:hypothetical protein